MGSGEGPGNIGYGVWAVGMDRGQGLAGRSEGEHTGGHITQKDHGARVRGCNLRFCCIQASGHEYFDM
eukprot:scaffold286633_cov33-Tisochrysis_lutea.AAC.1